MVDLFPSLSNVDSKLVENNLVGADVGVDELLLDAANQQTLGIQQRTFLLLHHRSSSPAGKETSHVTELNGKALK